MDLFLQKPKKPMGSRSNLATRGLGKLSMTQLKSDLGKVLKGSGILSKVISQLNKTDIVKNLFNSIKNIADKSQPMKKIKSRLGGNQPRSIAPRVKLPIQIRKVGGVRHLNGVVRVGGSVDGRHKRAMIVKKIMAEQGLPMIKASAYVKQHKLY